MKKEKYMGHIIALPEFIKEEYLSKKKKKAVFVSIEISPDIKYGAVAKIYERNSIFDRLQEKTTKKQRKEWSNKIKNIKETDKPVDTSNWVKPDEETIRNALIESFFALEILKEDSPEYRTYYGKAQAFYSILHGHSPKNPQLLNNWSIDPYFRKIMDELNCPVSKKYWSDFNKYFEKKNKSKNSWEKEKENYQLWKSKCLKNMIIPDPKPSAYKDIFKKTKKEINKNDRNKKENKTSNRNK